MKLSLLLLVISAPSRTNKLDIDLLVAENVDHHWSITTEN